MGGDSEVTEGVATIYVLCDSREADPIRRIRYVGRTVWPISRRLSAHCYSAQHGGRTRTACWIRSVMATGGQIRIEPIATVPVAWSDAAEIDLIAKHRALGCRLTNHTDGGGGILHADAATRAKISAVARGNKYWVGKTHTAEARAKISAAHLGRPMHPNTRAACQSPATRAKIAAALRARPHKPKPPKRDPTAPHPNTGRKMTAAWCAQRAAYARQHRHSDATKQRMGERQRGAAGPRAKLTWDQVHAIRTRYAAGGVTSRQLAQEHQVSRTTIDFILKRKTWVAA